jgi:hypothetical protein
VRRAALAILLLGCKGTIVNGGGEDEVVVGDDVEPLLHVTSPMRGTMAETPSVTVTGRASDGESGIRSLKINGAEVTVAADGTFSKQLPLSPGLTIIETELLDRGNNKTRDTRAVLSGTFAPADTMVGKAVAGKIGPGAFTVLGQMVSQYANALDLMSMVGNTRLVDEGGSCLGVEVDLRLIEKSGVSMQLNPKAGAVGTLLEVNGLHVQLRASFDVACIGGSTTIDLRADRMRLTGDLGMALSGETMAVSVSDLNVEFDGFSLNIGGVPGVIEDMIDGKVESEASNAIEGAVRQMVPEKATELLSEFVQGSWDVSILDRTASVTVRPTQVVIDTTGALVALDSKVLLSGGEGATFLSSPSELPASVMGSMTSFGIGLSDDLANQLFAGLWAARALEQTIELGPDHPARIFLGSQAERVEVELSLPPTVNADEQGNLRLALGDLILRVVDDNQGLGTLAEIAISATVQFTVQITADGRLTLVTANPRTWAQVVTQSEAQDPQLDPDVVESLGGVLMAQLNALADEALSGLPLPVVGDATATDASAESGGGYVVVRANLAPPP